MTITQHISIDLQQPGNMPMVHAVQGDEYTRKIEIELYSNGVSWNPPDGCEVAIRYGKPDGKVGIYAVLPDNTPAYSIAGNAITVTLAPQMVTVPGVVEVQVSIIKDRKDRISTFAFAVDVEADPSKGELKSENYVNWKSYYIPQTTGATVGQFLQISKVDDVGRIIETSPVENPAGEATNKAYEALRIANDVAQEMKDYSPSGTRAIAEAAMRTASSRLVAPPSASVGQYFRVKEVDANGVVTAVEAVDVPVDGGSVTHEWNGTVLKVTSAAGTSSADLKGEKGDTGAQGIQGEKGDKGDTGATGATGPAGEDGNDGNDYILTESDKTEIARKVPIVKVAEPPEFVNDISECTDTSRIYVLPNAHLCAYMTREVVTEGSTVPNFTNIYNKANGAYIKDGYRYSSSSAAFKEQANTCGIVVPLSNYTVNSQITLRVRGASMAVSGYAAANYVYVGKSNTALGNTGRNITSFATDSNGDIVITGTLADTFTHIVFHVDAGVDESALIVTQNEEITYTTVEGGTEIVTEWTDTGIAYNQPPSCSDSGGMDVFAFAAYPPSPQLPGDGSDKADFNTADVATSEVYAYMDALWERYRTYMVRQNLGKDASGQYDYYRYVFSKAYWRAWYKENYPKMYAWINGSTVIYSVSVSPRVGDTMYSTPYIGTAYNTVTAVNSETIGVASTRTVNGLVFTRHTDGDVEPTIVYTSPFAITANYKGRTYTNAFVASSSVKEFTHDYIIDSNDVKYFRYPFEDRKLNKSRLFSVFILANEHGNKGDSMIPCVTVLRMLKDLCSPTNNLFLKWLKENAVVTVIPLGNPYGGYNNANNVNINRNYDTPGWAGSDTDPAGGTKEEGAFGAYAGSEIETQYIMNTIQQCKAQTAVSYHGRGIPTGTLLGEYNSHGKFQGCGFDPERMWKVEEALFSMYNFGFSPDWHTVEDDSSNNYLSAGKSPSYIEYAGAVGGLVEIDDYEVGTLNSFTPLAMEQAYAEVLLVLQNWVEEALNK